MWRHHILQGSLGSRSSSVFLDDPLNDDAPAVPQEAKVSRLFSTMQQQGGEVAIAAACIGTMIVLISWTVSALLSWWHHTDDDDDRAKKEA